VNLEQQLASARNTVVRQRSQLCQISENLRMERQEVAKLKDVLFKLQIEREVRYNRQFYTTTDFVNTFVVQ